MASTTEIANNDIFYNTRNFYIGLGLAISSSGFIG